MRLSPLSSQNAYASAKASPTHSLTHTHARTQARTGVKLNEPLSSAYSNLRVVDLHFNRFLYGERGSGPVGASFKKGLVTPQFCPKLREAMLLLCQEGSIKLSALRGVGEERKRTHSHSVTINPNTGDAQFPYSIHTTDFELPKVRDDGNLSKRQTNAFVNQNGVASPYFDQPLSERLFFFTNENRLETEPYSLDPKRTNELKQPMHYFRQIGQNPQKVLVQLEDKKGLFNLADQQAKLPESFIKGLNLTFDILRDFNPELTYSKASHFIKP
jgi:hypothetical protein